MNRILLIAFLHRLKTDDPRLFIFVIAAIFLQLFLTFAKLAATPFFLYGMYSEKTPATDTFFITEIWINDKPLESYYSPLRERYLLESTAGNFEKIKNNNYTDPLKTRIESSYPFVYRSALYPFFSQRIYNSRASIDSYPGWFKKKCLEIAGVGDGNVKIIRTTLLLDKNTLQLNPVKNETLEDL